MAMLSFCPLQWVDDISALCWLHGKRFFATHQLWHMYEAYPGDTRQVPQLRSPRHWLELHHDSLELALSACLLLDQNSLDSCHRASPAMFGPIPASTEAPHSQAGPGEGTHVHISRAGDRGSDRQNYASGMHGQARTTCARLAPKARKRVQESAGEHTAFCIPDGDDNKVCAHHDA